MMAMTRSACMTPSSISRASSDASATEWMGTLRTSMASGMGFLPGRAQGTGSGNGSGGGLGGAARAGGGGGAGGVGCGAGGGHGGGARAAAGRGGDGGQVGDEGALAALLDEPAG